MLKSLLSMLLLLPLLLILSTLMMMLLLLGAVGWTEAEEAQSRVSESLP